VSNLERYIHAVKCFGDPQRRDDYFQFYSLDIVVHGYQGIKPGLESVKHFYYAFWEVFPDAQVKTEDIVEDGDKLVARYVITGTMHRDFLGVSSRRQRIELPGISIFHFRNGKCFERWTCSDSLILLNQIGGTVPQATNYGSTVVE
jgi:predicted ester cyclase